MQNQMLLFILHTLISICSRSGGVPLLYRNLFLGSIFIERTVLDRGLILANGPFPFVIRSNF